MNDDSKNSQSENSSAYWKSLTPKEFLITMLYELRTPMMVIKGYVKILSNENVKKDHPRAIEAISSSIDRMEKMYEDMEAYTRELMQKS